MVPLPPDTRVMVVAGDALTRAGLAALLADQPGYLVAGQAAVDSQLVPLVDVLQPDILLWDLGWESSASLEAMSQLTEEGHPVLALLPDESLATEVWSAGARGVLLRDSPVAAVLAALAATSQGMVVLDPSLAPSVRLPATGSSAHPAGELTPREHEVLQLLAEGLPNKAIAGRLVISEHTVKFHVNSILGKLDAQSRTEAVTRATRLGLLIL